MNFVSAICWTIVLVLNIVICATSDAPPSWVTMFCALSALTLNSWIDAWICNKKK